MIWMKKTGVSDMPRVATFRTWLEDCCCTFPAPDAHEQLD
jgi:hypothetical protein